MNFFERQARARRQSQRLVWMFAAAVLAVVVAVNLVCLVALGLVGRPFSEMLGPIFLVTLVTGGVIGLASLIRSGTLRSGGGRVAVELGGVRVSEDTQDPSLRRLRNVVEEIAIASGVPVPEIYVLEHESAINAFAAGWSPSDAAIGVTRGAIDRLNRDELQGVIAHEFSHVLNGDMRLNIRLVGALFGVVMLGLIGRKVLTHARFSRVGGRDSGGVAAVVLIALAITVIGYIGVFFARLIKAAVSRQREFLADASAVQFTRQTRGIAGALKKIAGVPDGSRLVQAEGEEVSHMLFGDGVGYSRLFATHPPLLERIRALEPTFRADELAELGRRWLHQPPDGMAEDRALGLAGTTNAVLPDGVAELDVVPPAVVAQVAEPGEDDYHRAEAIVGALPEDLLCLARQTGAAPALVLGLLVPREDKARAVQRKELSTRHGDAFADEVMARAERLAGLHPALRLPLAEIAFPVLRRRPRAELEAFADTAYALVHADGRLSAFEYCLGLLLQAQVIEALDPARHWRPGRRKLLDAKDEVAVLVSVLAGIGHRDPNEARRAYHAGMALALPHQNVPYMARGHDPRVLDPVWPILDELQPPAKAMLLEGLVAAISHDGRVTVGEAELLRTVCGVLHCPLPPMLDTKA